MTESFFADMVKCPIGVGQWIVLTLTANGYQLSQRWKRGADGSYTVPMASRVFDQITGITDGPNGTKIAEFSWRWKIAPTGGADLFPWYAWERKTAVLRSNFTTMDGVF